MRSLSISQGGDTWGETCKMGLPALEEISVVVTGLQQIPQEQVASCPLVTSTHTATSVMPPAMNTNQRLKQWELPNFGPSG